MDDKGTMVQQLEAERDYLLEKIGLLCSEKTDLKSRLQKVKKAAEPIGVFVEHLEPSVRDNYIMSDTSLVGELSVVYIKYSDIRRLVEALKEVKDE